MTKRLKATWHADPDRIYATGISNGAYSGDEEAGVNATDLMWDFFAAHPKQRP